MKSVNKSSGVGTIAGIIAAGCLLAVGLFLLSAVVWMVAWNTAAPAFGWSPIDYAQALAMVMLVSMVGGAFRAVVSRS